MKKEYKNIICPEFYKRDTITVAKELLGKEFVHILKGEPLISRITETEAYLGENDKASHTYGGLRTQRTETMYLPGGHLYVYLIYGIYSLVNVITQDEENPTGVMIRSAEPVKGFDTMATLRFSKEYNQLTSFQKKNLTNGPGKFSMAMGIDTSFDGKDLFQKDLYIQDTGFAVEKIGAGQRINIDYAEEDALLPLRFFIEK